MLKVIFEPADEGGYTAYVPALPGCVAKGDKLEEARRNIREAIELYLQPVDELTPPAAWAVRSQAPRNSLSADARIFSQA